MDAGPSPAAGSAPVPFEENALAPRRPMSDDARFDVTAMVDLVFMMNIFFLVTWVTSALAEMDLPKARHCSGADAEQSVVISVLKGPQIFLGEPEKGHALSANEVDQRVQAVIEEGMREDRKFVLIKAEKDVVLRDIAHLAGIASNVLGAKLRLAVIQRNTE